MNNNQCPACNTARICGACNVSGGGLSDLAMRIKTNTDVLRNDPKTEKCEFSIVCEQRGNLFAGSMIVPSKIQGREFSVIRPINMIVNSPAPKVLKLHSVLQANIDVLVGGNDAFDFSPLKQRRDDEFGFLEMVCDCNKISVLGEIIGDIPAEYKIIVKFICLGRPMTDTERKERKQIAEL